MTEIMAIVFGLVFICFLINIIFDQKIIELYVKLCYYGIGVSKMEECIKDFLFDNWDYGFVITGLGAEIYLNGEQTVKFLQNENVEIDLLLDDILYILVGGIPCSVEPN